MLNYFLITLILFFAKLVSPAIQYPNCTVDHSSATAWSVDCSSLDLNLFPEHLLAHPVKNLTFVHNNLNSSTNFGVWKDLEHLNVAFNKLTHISNTTFIGLESLIYLNISYNGITSLDASAFNILPALRELDISGNRVLGKHVTNLDIALNITLLRGLKKLYLANLGLHEISENFFDRAELSLLDISNNNLIKLPVFPKSLAVLDISNNSLIELSYHPFLHSRYLYTIISEDNKNLTEISSDCFHGLPFLKYVSFRGCSSLDTIHYGTFYSNDDLQYLSIASCNFKTLPDNLKSIFLRIDVVDLQDNPWFCNRAIRWFYKLDMPKNITENLRCAQPRNMSMIDFYGPKRHHEILKIFLGVLVILVFAFFAVGLYFAYEVEKKRQLAHPYTRLDRGAPISSPVYVSTVV